MEKDLSVELVHEKKKNLNASAPWKKKKEERDANLLPARLDRISPDATQKEEKKNRN